MATATFDPFREFERLFTGVATPQSSNLSMDLYKKGDVFVAEIDMPALTLRRLILISTTAPLPCAPSALRYPERTLSGSPANDATARSPVSSLLDADLLPTVLKQPMKTAS